MRIVFMGTPDFAVPALHALVSAGHDIAAVVTRPDKASGRGRKIQPAPVKAAALEAGLPLMQPNDLRDTLFHTQLADLNADCYIVVAFRILPEAVFLQPPLGTVNLHASLLPKYRGAAPIQWAIIRGETETGVTTFYVRKKVDTGSIILQQPVSIGPEDNAGSMHDKLAGAGAGLVVRTARLIQARQAPSIPQEGTVTTAPKIENHHCRIDWFDSAEHIHNLVRGLSPRPGARTVWRQKQLKILKTAPVTSMAADAGGEPGTVVRAASGCLQVNTGNGQIEILTLQLEGKRQIDAASFLRGSDLERGEMLRES